MAKRIGAETIEFESNICVTQTYSTVGPYEGKGPLRSYFSEVLTDDLCGQKSYEQAETCILKNSLSKLIELSGKKITDLNIFLGGDLLDQITPTTFAVKAFARPFWGLYNACATFSLGMQVASCMLESGAADNAIISASSHFSTSERQYRSRWSWAVKTR